MGKTPTLITAETKSPYRAPLTAKSSMARISPRKLVSFQPEPEAQPKEATKPPNPKISAQNQRRAAQRAKLKSQGAFHVVERPLPGQTSANGGPDEDITQNWAALFGDGDATCAMEEQDEVGDEVLALEWGRFRFKMGLLSSMPAAAAAITLVTAEKSAASGMDVEGAEETVEGWRKRKRSPEGQD